MISGPLVAAFLAVAVGAGALGAYADRAVLLAVDARCGLLSAPERAALAASARQARGALARAGWSEAQLAASERDLRAGAAAIACRDETVAAETARAKAAFEAWRALHAARFPGEARAWNARRTPDPSGWLLWQDLEAGARFGVRAGPQGPRLTLAAPAGRTVAARLAARDPDLFAEPTTTPLRGAASVWLADARTATPAGVLYTFPDAALLALGDLDPRDGALVELTGPDGSVQARDRIEIGDFAAAAAFLAIGG